MTRKCLCANGAEPFVRTISETKRVIPMSAYLPTNVRSEPLECRTKCFFIPSIASMKSSLNLPMHNKTWDDYIELSDNHSVINDNRSVINEYAHIPNRRAYIRLFILMVRWRHHSLRLGVVCTCPPKTMASAWNCLPSPHFTNTCEAKI